MLTLSQASFIVDHALAYARAQDMAPMTIVAAQEPWKCRSCHGLPLASLLSGYGSRATRTWMRTPHRGVRVLSGRANGGNSILCPVKLEEPLHLCGDDPPSRLSPCH